MYQQCNSLNNASTGQEIQSSELDHGAMKEGELV